MTSSMSLFLSSKLFLMLLCYVIIVMLLMFLMLKLMQLKCFARYFSIHIGCI